MPTIRFTARGVARLVPLPGQTRTDFWDESLPGFGLRVSPTRRTWCVLYRHSRRLRRLKIGTYPLMSLVKARGEARTALLAAGNGADPAGEKAAARDAKTIGDLWTLYLEKHAKLRKKTWRADASLWRRKLERPLRHVALRALTRGDVRRLVCAIAEAGAPILANRVHALLRKMLNVAIEHELLEANPAAHLHRPGLERRRDRVLSDNEIRALWAALETQPADVADFYRLRLLTAQRGGEVVRMRWADLDLEVGLWVIPGEHSKNGLPHRVPLSPPALAILKARREAVPVDSVWVFPSTHKGAPAIQAMRGTCRVIGTGARVDDFRGHDLRRTAATRMTSAGISRLVVGKILNHAEAGVTAVYDRASYDLEKRTALETWARTLHQILEATPDAGKVLTFSR